MPKKKELSFEDEQFRRDQERQKEFQKDSDERFRASGFASRLKNRLDEHIYHAKQVSDLLNLRGSIKGYSRDHAVAVSDKGGASFGPLVLLAAIEAQLYIEREWLEKNPI